MTDERERDDRRTIAVSERVHEHVEAMAMPEESASETLERLLGLTPDPATLDGDALETALPDDPVVPDAIATDPTVESATDVDPGEIVAGTTAPPRVDADEALGDLAAVLDAEERAELEALLAEIDDADADTLAGIVALVADERGEDGERNGTDERSEDDAVGDDDTRD